jgi:hypothetical protein
MKNSRIAHSYCSPLFLVVLGFLSFRPLCFAQDQTKEVEKTDKITKVTPLNEKGQKITQLEIDLQNAPDNMEPAAEPRRIRVDDRANVQFLLKNLSPLDLCSRTAGTPTATPETPVAESLVGAVAKLGGLAIGTSTAGLAANSRMSANLTAKNQEQLKTLHVEPKPDCKVQVDAEYKKILDVSEDFFTRASNLIGTATEDGKCRSDQADQVELACEIDSATRQLADFAGADYRGTYQARFQVDGNSDLKGVRDAYTLSLNSIDDAGKLQAMVDEMTTWALDLHKKYDYTVSVADSGSPTPPPIVAGALMVSPTSLSFNPATLTQVVQLSSGGQPGTFTATPSSDGDWLLLSKPGPTPPSAAMLRDTAPARGTFDLLVTVSPAGLDAKTHYGAITVSGTGSAKGTTLVNATFKPVSQPSDCDLESLRKVDEIVDRAKAEMSLLSDNNKALEGAQGTLKASYMALVKVEDDFKRRKTQKIVTLEADGVLVQEFNLGTDRKATSPGYISCVSDIDGKTPTTTNINYSLLYQDVPHWSASAGLLTSFLEKKIIGVSNESTSGTSPPANMQVFRVTDRAQVQLIPMAYVNYRIAYKSSHYGKGKEDELVWTTHLSSGFGVNPNTGTNQPEFFLGLAFGMNHFMIHPGIHFGRTESLGGGYSLNAPVPMGLSTAPISWSYHPAFSIGFSVRVAPY